MTTSFSVAVPDIKAGRRFSKFSVMMAIVCGSIAFVPSVAGAADDPATTIKTVGGVLRVVKPESEAQRLTLNNKPISRMEGNRSYPMEDDAVLLKQKFLVDGNDVVLVQTNCEGTSCNSSTLYFVTISSTGKATVSEGMDADEDGTANVKATGNALTLTTETYQGRRKKTNTWIYSTGKVAKSK